MDNNLIPSGQDKDYLYFTENVNDVMVSVRQNKITNVITYNFDELATALGFKSTHEMCLAVLNNPDAPQDLKQEAETLIACINLTKEQSISNN